MEDSFENYTPDTNILDVTIKYVIGKELVHNIMSDNFWKTIERDWEEFYVNKGIEYIELLEDFKKKEKNKISLLLMYSMSIPILI